MNSFPLDSSRSRRSKSPSRRLSRSWPPTPSSPAAPRTAPAKSQEARLQVVYDQSYPPATTDFADGARRTGDEPRHLLLAAYPPDNVGIIRAANEINFQPKMFGGAMIGMLITPIQRAARDRRERAGDRRDLPALAEAPVPRPRRPDEALSGEGAGTEDRSARLCVRADRLRRRPGAGAAVEAPRASTTTRSPSGCGKLTFKTIVGDVAFAKDGEWTKARSVRHAGPVRGAEQSATSSVTARGRRYCGRPV